MEQSFSFISSDSKEAYYLCFTKTDLFRVREIVEDLRRYNLELSYLTSDVKDREEQIAIRIQNCKGVLFFVSKNVLSADDTDMKTQYEMAAHFLEKPVYPIILDDVKDADVSETLFGWWVELKNMTCIENPTAFTIIQALNIETNLNVHESVSATSMSDLLDRYQHYVQIEDYENAALVLMQLSSQGHAISQNELGICYEKGLGVKQDLSLAMKYYEMAAAQDLPLAQNNLGACYLNYDECCDYGKAFSYFKLAADKGLALAECNLAKCYFSGMGVKQSFSKAVKYLKSPAEQGIPDAQFLLGTCYHDGAGVWKNKKKAAFLIRSAADQGIEEAQLLYGMICYSGDGVEEDYATAFKYFSLAAEQGDFDAIAYLGIFYDNGFCVEQNVEKALELLRKSAEGGSALGELYLADCLLNENCTDEEYDEAVRLLRLSAQQDWDDQAEAIKRLKQLGEF